MVTERVFEPVPFTIVPLSEPRPVPVRLNLEVPEVPALVTPPVSAKVPEAPLASSVNVPPLPTRLITRLLLLPVPVYCSVPVVERAMMLLAPAAGVPRALAVALPPSWMELIESVPPLIVVVPV